MPPAPDRAPPWGLLFELATGQAGYFTARQAAALGFSPALLSVSRRRGKLLHVFSRVYRFVFYPPSEHEELVVPWLASEREGVFSHETALVLHQLSDALPSRLHLTLPRTWKRRLLPGGLDRFYAELAAEDVVWIGPVRVTSPSRTLRDCAAVHTSAELLTQAHDQARARGLLSPAAAD